MTSKNHYVIFGRSFIVLLVPFLVLKPLKNEIKCFSAFISCEREECTTSPGFLPVEESNEAGTDWGAQRKCSVHLALDKVSLEAGVSNHSVFV